MDASSIEQTATIGNNSLSVQVETINGDVTINNFPRPTFDFFHSGRQMAFIQQCISECKKNGHVELVSKTQLREQVLSKFNDSGEDLNRYDDEVVPILEKLFAMNFNGCQRIVAETGYRINA